MAVLNNIVIHHSGGLGNDNLASTRHLTFNDIGRYHKNKGVRQGYNPYSKMGYPHAYNAMYDPKLRIFKQFREIGEETMAQRGSNFDTFSLGIIGNYNKQKNVYRPVDPVEEYMEEDIAKYLFDLLNGNKRKLVVSPNAELNFSRTRIYAHRFFSNTDCYGTFLSDNWARDLLVKYKQVIINDIVRLKKRIKILQEFIKIYIQLINLFTKKRMMDKALSGVGDFECEGFVS